MKQKLILWPVLSQTWGWNFSRSNKCTNHELTSQEVLSKYSDCFAQKWSWCVPSYESVHLYKVSSGNVEPLFLWEAEEEGLPDCKLNRDVEPSPCQPPRRLTHAHLRLLPAHNEQCVPSIPGKTDSSVCSDGWGWTKSRNLVKYA